MGNQICINCKEIFFNPHGNKRRFCSMMCRQEFTSKCTNNPKLKKKLSGILRRDERRFFRWCDDCGKRFSPTGRLGVYCKHCKKKRFKKTVDKMVARSKKTRGGNKYAWKLRSYGKEIRI